MSGIHEKVSEKSDFEEKQETPELKSLGQIWRNVLVLGVSFAFMFTAYRPLQDLQSSLFKEDGMGTTVIAVVYASLLVSSLFLPSFLINLLGCKWSLTVSMAGFIMLMTTPFYPYWELLIPAAILAGVSAGPLMGSMSQYLNTLAHDYAKMKGVTNAAATSLFFGVFFLFFHSSMIWGNIISSQVLTPADANSSVHPLPAEELLLCGRGFCPQAQESNNSNLQTPPKAMLYTLAGCYTGSACIAVLIVVVLLQQLPEERDRKLCVCTKATCKPKLLVATFLHMKERKQLLLMPITMFCGLQQAFFSGDFTQAFITCPLGSWWVGYILICYGIVDACCSLLFGKLVQFVGRAPFFILGAAINVGLIISFLSLSTTQDRIYQYFIFAGLWGMSDAIWQSQINALYGVLFKDNSKAAFSNYRLFEAFSMVTAFSYQSHLCLPVKAYILLAVLAIGMAGYGTVEYMERKTTKVQESD